MSRTTGAPCKRRPSPGRTRCRLHGGRTPRGFALGGTTHGRYSKDLPSRLLGEYEAARADPELWTLRDEAALVSARIADLVTDLDETCTPMHFPAAREAFAKFRDAQRRASVADANRALADCEALLTQGADGTRTWALLLEAIDAKRKLSESETKRLKDLHQMVSLEKLLALMGSVVSVVRMHVTDPEQLRFIHRDLSDLLRGTSPLLPGGLDE